MFKEENRNTQRECVVPKGERESGGNLQNRTALLKKKRKRGANTRAVVFIEGGIWSGDQRAVWFY